MDPRHDPDVQIPAVWIMNDILAFPHRLPIPVLTFQRFNQDWTISKDEPRVMSAGGGAECSGVEESNSDECRRSSAVVRRKAGPSPWKTTEGL